MFSDVPVVFSIVETLPSPYASASTGGTISLESITCTSTKYPIAITTETTPVTIAVPCPFTSGSAVIGFIGASIGCPMLDASISCFTSPRSSSTLAFVVVIVKGLSRLPLPRFFAFGETHARVGLPTFCREERHLPRPLDATRKVLDAQEEEKEEEDEEEEEEEEKPGVVRRVATSMMSTVIITVLSRLFKKEEGASKRKDLRKKSQKKKEILNPNHIKP